ncbi:hypothetical protein AGMMS49959_05210 [Planctomycetales bacterium]|nr:hypothetical protein AGMMS49959_05210 [Planctomycetales bacterium]
MSRFAHLSDLHLVAPFAWREWRRHCDWRPRSALALANWFWRRRRQQHNENLAAALTAIIAARADFVVITGDLTQCGRAVDFAFFLDQMAPLRRAQIPTLLIAGNHDFYFHPAPAENFAALRRELSLDLRWDGKPLRVGDVDLLPVDGARVVPLAQAWGEAAALDELKTAWRALPPAPAQTRVAAGHFPLRDAANNFLPEATRLNGGDAVLDLLAAEVAAYLCGHIHRPFTTVLPGGVRQHCAGSITLGGKMNLFSATGGKFRVES